MQGIDQFACFNRGEKGAKCCVGYVSNATSRHAKCCPALVRAILSSVWFLESSWVKATGKLSRWQMHSCVTSDEFMSTVKKLENATLQHSNQQFDCRLLLHDRYYLKGNIEPGYSHAVSCDVPLSRIGSSRHVPESLGQL